MGDANLETSPELCNALNRISLQQETTLKRITLSPDKFNGKAFYEKYKNADFLKTNRNITKILSSRDEITSALSSMEDGEKLVINEMFIKPGVPLIITRSGTIDQSDVENNDFTLRRLTGLTAAYVWNNVDKFEGIYASEPEALGLCWAPTLWQRKLYLSAVFGAELFEEFEYIPFPCALKKFSLKIMSEELLLYIASKPNPITGEPMAALYRRNYNDSDRYNNKLFKAPNSCGMTNFIYGIAPPSVQRYLTNLGNI